MTPKTRELILRISAGHPQTLRPLHLFSRLSYCDTIFMRMINQGIIGNRLVDFFYKDMKGSFINSVHYLMGNTAPIKAGKDFI
jgi:hypothetical protein